MPQPRLRARTRTNEADLPVFELVDHSFDGQRKRQLIAACRAAGGGFLIDNITLDRLWWLIKRSGYAGPLDVAAIQRLLDAGDNGAFDAEVQAHAARIVAIGVGEWVAETAARYGVSVRRLMARFRTHRERWEREPLQPPDDWALPERLVFARALGENGPFGPIADLAA